ncbi:hypothetical protein HAX54_042192 [Datura stramonium]|uniref:Uncharacterized protein n=1 Tax=Datura stramonium TaxID=4076 RepID=A0ABS8W1B7_DATST|nr:hypothetical protein [Datura stramonium]
MTRHTVVVCLVSCWWSREIVPDTTSHDRLMGPYNESWSGVVASSKVTGLVKMLLDFRAKRFPFLGGATCQSGVPPVPIREQLRRSAWEVNLGPTGTGTDGSQALTHVTPMLIPFWSVTSTLHAAFLWLHQEERPVPSG